MSGSCFCVWRGLNTTQKEKITMKNKSSTTVVKNESYKRYNCKPGVYLQQFNKPAHKYHRKATNTMCTVFFDVWLRENTTSIYVECERNVDFGVPQCRLILLHENGVSLSGCLTASDFKMAGISTTFIWSLCCQLSGSLTKSFLKVVLYFHTSCRANIFYILQNTVYSVKPRLERTEMKALKHYTGELHHQRKRDYCFVLRCLVQSLFSHIHRSHLLKQTRKLAHIKNELCWKNDGKMKITANLKEKRYTVLDDYCNSGIVFSTQFEKRRDACRKLLYQVLEGNNSFTPKVKDTKSWDILFQNFSRYSEIFVCPSFRRNDLGYSFKQIVAGTQYLSSDIMRFEHHRLSTFANYNNTDAPSLLRMAKYGWYATGFGNETKTFCCSVVNAIWSKDDNPFEIHKHFQPNCSFILGCDLGQVSIQDDRSKPSSISDSSSSSAVLGTPCNGASTLSNSIHLPGTENNDEIALQSAETNLNLSASGIEHKARVEQFPSSTSNFKDKHEMSKEVEARLVGDRLDHEDVEHTRWLTSDSRLASSFNADCPSTSVEPAGRIKSSDNLSDAERVNVTDIENLPRPATLNKQDRESETIHDKPHSDVVYQEPVLPPLVPENPQYVEYTTVGIRASSFSGFPIGSGKTPKEFAIGGFYYRGFGDRTTCFQCGISLQNWSADDDVFVEHARHNPLCQYIRQLKGDDFVKLVLIATGNHEVDIKSSIRYQGVEKESTCLLYCMFISV